MSPDRLTNNVVSRPFAILLVVTGILFTFIGFHVALPPADVINRSFGLLSPNLWISNPLTSLLVNTALELVAIAMLLALNRSYNLMRDGQYLLPALFILMQSALPAIGERFSGGILLMWLMLGATAVLYSVYLRPDLTRRIFLIFALASAGVMIQYGFLIILPVLIIGCAQMRVMSFRTILAIILGLITPIWIVVGGGLIPGGLQLPEFRLDFDIFESENITELITVGFSMLTGIVTGLVNLVSVYARNARTRAFHGLLLVAGVMAGIGCVVDFSNMLFYIPLLNMATAYQVSLYISLHPDKKRSVTIIIVSAVYAILFLSNLVV